eukprot:CAMPEP_0206224014 /NCGR_PEP_ID=MMETSP0047_2-20121206/6797_1 /ASSEMBLY_ACC=CAM_ASM_000192 /TAXON_ID=195065 /ORGANISM="Chroomonas mesostigmatica_cf, Strain CCMP1168" /LENGTH=64 /DNA_ID=CAMNT_0053646937 /DNA_START=442 /DNA_END=633 /DNA_ORIENTATION=+
MPPPYFLAPGVAGFWERQARLAVACQRDIQAINTLETVEFFSRPTLPHTQPLVEGLAYSLEPNA